jgi:putative zinc finger/helix-turn-helix YgiT family protein
MDKNMCSKNNNLHEDRDLRCPECDQNMIETSFEECTFKYGSAENEVELKAVMPIRICKSCELRFMDSEADDARHKAVCKYLKVLTSHNIKNIRKLYGLSRSQFSEITRLGIATLSRWEKGILIQNSAYDNYLYLLRWKENLDRLRNRNYEEEDFIQATHDAVPFIPKFRVLNPTNEMVSKSREFNLYSEAI